MRRSLMAVVALCIALLPPVAGATDTTDTEPQVYFFWSASCSFSRSALSFLQGAQSKDPKLQVRDFEVDNSLSNTLLLGKVYDKIGLPEFWVVPLIVVGHHLIIGYNDAETTGRDVLNHVAECRKTGCKDMVRDLIGEPRTYDEASAAASVKSTICTSLQRQP